MSRNVIKEKTTTILFATSATTFHPVEHFVVTCWKTSWLYFDHSSHNLSNNFFVATIWGNPSHYSKWVFQLRQKFIERKNMMI
jgi:hypothetical protein